MKGKNRNFTRLELLHNVINRVFCHKFLLTLIIIVVILMEKIVRKISLIKFYFKNFKDENKVKILNCVLLFNSIIFGRRIIFIIIVK